VHYSEAHIIVVVQYKQFTAVNLVGVHTVNSLQHAPVVFTQLHLLQTGMRYGYVCYCDFANSQVILLLLC